MKNLFILLWSSLAIACYAQEAYSPNYYYYGFKGGATYHQIDEIATTIIPPFFGEDTYRTEVMPQAGYAGGIFFYYRFGEGALAIQPEITYGTLSSRFKYEDIDELTYQIDFDYQYLHLGTFLKIYPFNKDGGGLHIALGPQLSFNTSNEKIHYDSNRPDIGPNLQIQQNLRNVLKGETLFSAGLGLGYEFKFGLQVEARYHHGLSDAIETQANGYFFIENDNRTKTVQVMLGYAIPFPSYSPY